MWPFKCIFLIVILTISNYSVNCFFLYYQNYEYFSTIKLNDYNGYYGNVKLLRYSMPNDVLSAIWRLQLVSSDNCPATDVYFYLEYSAYPVISPHNRTFPYYFNQGRLTKTMIKKTLGGSNPSKQDVYLNISSPYPGYWFSAAFTDIQDQKVKPDILKSNCTHFLTSSLNIWQINDTAVLYPNATTHSTEHSIFKMYKYMSTSFGPSLSFKFKQNSTNVCSLTALLRQSAFPDMNNFKINNDHITCLSNSTQNCILSIEYPLDNTWYYLAVTSDCNYSVDVLLPNNCIEQSISIFNETLINLVENLYPGRMKRKSGEFCTKYFQPIETFRFIGPTYFSVKYYFNSNHNRSNALLIRNERKPYFIEFLVDQANNGGTLNFYLVNNLISDPNLFDTEYLSSKPTNVPNDSLNPPDLNNTNNTSVNVKSKISGLAEIKVMLYACLLFNSMSSYKNCPEGFLISTQSFTNIFTNVQLNIAYPFMGKWYLAVWKECFNINTNESVPCPTTYVPHALIQISSDQCANDYCGDYGTCYIINSQLNLVSACKCSGGYEGFGCTDGRNAIPARIYLASVLFLTTSNLVFLLPICLAIYRKWYIESLIYFYNMFFSTFYHACDQEFYSFCIFNYDGLQLADFISSYSSFIITVLAMSSFQRQWKIFTFFVGLLACLSIGLYDRFSYVTFVVFLCIAISFTVFTWVKICISKRKLHPERNQLLKFYLPGFILAVTGLLIYSFLQTKSNYWILHSIWHMCMASSIIFFLPKEDMPDFGKENSGENLKDVTATTSSLSESSAISGSPVTTKGLLHSNITEISLLEP
ncbi:unnamed protein product [Brachionus calyciflorus]|uniref:EGF-like domain-containing protein n=1 Tax=Brachionus calyciflorus TaxID=104777 RepID=A0A813RYU9_9BILA|nr:unnamed protein product [Brachionus calyciflorus]